MAGSGEKMGPVARTQLLVVYSGLVGGMVSSRLQAECVEGLLSYARLFFAQPHAGKLSTLAAAGRRVHTVTNWDPGQQSVEAIVQGLAEWKAPEGDSGFSIKLILKEVIRSLFQAPGTAGVIADKSTTGLEVAAMSRTRLIVIFPQDFGAGNGIQVYHNFVVEALAGVNTRETGLETIFLDVTNSESIDKPSMCTFAANGIFHLATTYYKLLPMHASDLFIDLAYFHLDLSAIAVKGMLPHLLELSGDNAVKLAVKEREMKDEKVAAAVETALRLVICQRNSLPLQNGGSEVSLVPGSPIFRECRTTMLNYLKTTFSISELLALPCVSSVPTLPEVFQRGPSAKLWENLKHQDNDKVIITLSSEEHGGNMTHLLIWRDGGFWLFTVTRAEDKNGVCNVEVGNKRDEGPGDSEVGPQRQVDILHNMSEGLLTTPPRKASNVEKTSVHSAKKRKQEETDDSVPQGSQNQATWRHKRSGTHSSKQLERMARWSSAASSDTIVGGREQHSTQLSALVSTIRGAFVGVEPTDHLANPSKCVAKLLEFTKSNDVSIFPSTSELPAARKDLYTRVWLELDTLAKQTQDKTHEQEELAKEIATVAEVNRLPEERTSAAIPHPVNVEKSSDFAPVNKRRRCEEVPRDAQGRPVFPIKLGPSLQVYDLGKIVWNRPNFHSEKYIWPAGYKSRRAYASMLNSENRIFYWCEIVDDGQAPEFRLTPEDDQSNPVVGISATAVWTVVVKRVGALRIEEGGKKTFANVSGPEYFGYANPTIARLIQQLPDAEKCTKYRRQDYLPNVPMRTLDIEVTQGVLAPECPPSPNVSKDVPLKTPPPPHPEEAVTHASVVPIIPPLIIPLENLEDASQLLHEEDAPFEEIIYSPAGAPCKEEEVQLEPLSWLSEFHITKRLKEVGKFPRQFAGCSPGSLFNHYWSAKLRRLRCVELDGRQ